MNLAPLPGEVHPLVLLAVALAPPLLLWFGLAVGQALRTDPDRSRRRGQKALQRLMRRCRGRTPSRLELETGHGCGRKRSARCIPAARP